MAFFEKDDFLGAMGEAEKESARSTDLLFGKCKASGGDDCDCRSCEPPDDEFEIIKDSTLSFEEKMAKLQVLRGDKKAKPRSFRKRVTRTDAIHARALGISLS